MVIAIVWPERLPLVAYGAAAKSACPAVVVVLTTLAKPQPRATAGGICRGVHARFEG